MSNMYPEVVTRNPLGGECSHRCKYCYMKSYPMNLTKKYTGSLFLDKKGLSRIKKSKNIIFICSGNDLFANSVPKEFIEKIINRCKEFPSNTYLFQTKNPYRFNKFTFPFNSILGTTAETNRNYNLSKAPEPEDRLIDLAHVKLKFPKMISIEPILDFDIVEFMELIKRVKPSYVSIGADSKGHNLQEPSSEKITILIEELKKFTEVRLKSNLDRLVKI